MTFNVMAIGRPDDPEMLEYPSIGPDLKMVGERIDGSRSVSFGATMVQVFRRNAGGSKYTKEFELGKVKFECQITASRVSIYCRNFDRGGGWYGGPVSMIVLNVGSKALAAGRRRGKALVGHLRYPWINQVLFHPKAGFLSSEFLRLVYSDGTDGGTSCYLDIVVDRTHDTASLAWEIVERALAYRYSNGESFSADEVRDFQRLRRRGKQTAPNNDGSGFGQYEFPTAFKVPGGMQHAPAQAPPPLLRIPAPAPAANSTGPAAAAAAGPTGLFAAAPAPSDSLSVVVAPGAPLLPSADISFIPTLARDVPVAALPTPMPTPPTAIAAGFVASRLHADDPLVVLPEHAGTGDPAWRTREETVLRFDTGEMVSLTGSVLVGRSPAGSDGEPIDRLVAISDPARSISKTHLLIRRSDRGVIVTDRHSTNGVTVETQGATEVCLPGVEVLVPAGAVIRYGERSVRIDRVGSSPVIPGGIQMSSCPRCARPVQGGRFCGFCGAQLSPL